MSQEMKSIRLIVVDDHLIVREGLRMVLEIAGEGFQLVGDAADGTIALRLIEELQPDVVLMDLRMPGMDGLEALTQIHARWPQIAVIILTTYNEDDLIMRGLSAGARGYLLKDVNRETLFNAIRAAARGEMLLSPKIMAHILTRPLQQDSQSTNDNILTAREKEVLLCITRGAHSKEVAAQLGISLRTVGAHLTSIYTKLNVDSRASAVAVAVERKLLTP
ncbi:MAG TPA: response regulator transcription factor [Ktedonobacteraceae bacterium]|jgi:NarL family two-component system response regulator YdfI|nr:response regulator transcription factor [Ktedonobacteraceae bacterium]